LLNWIILPKIHDSSEFPQIRQSRYKTPLHHLVMSDIASNKKSFDFRFYQVLLFLFVSDWQKLIKSTAWHSIFLTTTHFTSLSDVLPSSTINFLAWPYYSKCFQSPPSVPISKWYPLQKWNGTEPYSLAFHLNKIYRQKNMFAIRNWKIHLIFDLHFVFFGYSIDEYEE
jgi:hypothetical protein